jgi:endonuclease YncB( thermonuclease family)
MKRLFLLLAFCLLPSLSLAWSGRIVGVTDGDTLTVLRGQKQVKVRLYGIDAPERRQAWGDRARQALGELAHGQAVEVQEMDVDRYGRTVAQLEVQGQDVGTEMVRRGLAWVYERYCTIPDCGAMRRAQAEAQAARTGLWADPSPTPPWDWRRAK